MSCSLSVPVDAAADYERPDFTRDRIVEPGTVVRFTPAPTVSAFTRNAISPPVSGGTPPEVPPPRPA
ncbi:MAG TPA: hypothetical protein VGJ81_18120 [Thermoanaerobaculia bacterium]